MYSASATDLHTQRIRIQQTRLLYAQAPLGIIASLLIAPLVVLVAWDAIPRSVLLTWLALLETTVAVRLALTLAFRHRAHKDADPTRWQVLYTWACAASGGCWGSAVILLILSPSLIYDALIALVLGGVLMGGVLTMAPLFTAYLAYALPLTLPSIFWLLLQGDPIHAAMGAIGGLYLLLAVGTAHRYHRILTRSLRLALENGELAHSFAIAREQAEENHRQLAVQQAALKDSVEAMRELYQVISTPSHNTERMQAMLAMGCQRFGLANGILACIEGERYEITQVYPPHGPIQSGDVFALGDTYCRDTLRHQGPLGFEDAATGLQRHHPCYRKFGLEAYLGIRVWVGNVLYGTLNFSDSRPRATPFTTVDQELIQLMAEWMGGALERERLAAATRRQQALLAHASRINTLGEMASRLVHEINQPLTAITLYAEAALTRRCPPEPVDPRETLEKIIAQSTRAGAIIQRIRRFARQGKAQHAPVRIHDLLNEIADFLDLETQRHAIRIRYDVASDLPPVLADGLQVQQVLLNLVRNAIDAMSNTLNPSAIAISARLDREMVEIAVQDTGAGLEPGITGQLLHPFFTTKPNGLGLGLSISQSIIEAHSGRLWATSNSGPGATFHFTLPVACCVEPSSGALTTLPAEAR